MARKIACCLVAVAFVLALGTSLSAENKSQPLKERVDAQADEIQQLKQMFEAFKAEREKETGGTSGYDHGFFIGSRDKNYSLKFRFFGDIFYEFDKNQDAENTNTFGLRRARLLLSGNVFDPRLTYMLMAEMVTTYGATLSTTNYAVVDSAGNTSAFSVTDTTDRNFRLLYMWVQYKFADEFQIRAGEFIPPTEYFFRASNLLQMCDFPIIATFEPFTPNFQTGLDLLGTIAKKVDYEIFAVNASSLDRTNLNKSFRIGPMVTFNILGKPGLGVADVDYSESPQLALTLSGAYEHADSTQAAPVGINKNDTLFRGQTNAVFRYRGFALVPQFIVVYDRTQHFKHYAVAGQAGYFIIPKHLELAGQANILKYSGPSNDRDEFSVGLNYYFFGHPVKLQLDYSYLINQQATGSLHNHRVRVNTQVGFF